MKTLILTTGEFEMLLSLMERHESKLNGAIEAMNNHPVAQFINFIKSNKEMLSEKEQRELDEKIAAFESERDKLAGDLLSLIQKVKLLHSQSEN